MVVTHKELNRQATQPGVGNEVRQAGFNLGVRSASMLSQKDFQHFDRVQPLAASFDEDVVDYLWTFLDSHGCSQEGRVRDAALTQALEADPQNGIVFTQGWLDGVLSVGGR